MYALSYDEPEALNAFAEEHGITYTLLSDPNSEVIKHFGILNTLIPEDDHPWHGIPFPGAYVFGYNGQIRDKIFEGHLAMRVSGERLLSVLADVTSDQRTDSSMAAGEYLMAQPVVLWQNFGKDGFDITVKAQSAELPPGIMRELYVRVVPLSKGNVIQEMNLVLGAKDETAAQITSDKPSSDEPSSDEPSSDKPGSLIDLGGFYSPHEYDTHSDIWILRSFLHNGSDVRTLLDGQRVVPVYGTITWRAEFDEEYQETFEILIPAGRINTAHYEDVQPGQMDAVYHMNVLRSRRGLPAT